MSGYVFQDRDVIDSAVYAELGHPREAFRWLRSNDPVRWVTPEGYDPFWAITKHADIVEIEKQPEVFASEPRPIIVRDTALQELPKQRRDEVVRRLSDTPKLLEVLATSGEGGLIRSLVQMDPPDHTAYRELVQPWFKPGNIKALEERMGVIIRDILDDMMGDGGVREIDFARDVAGYPPLRLITELLGVPGEDEWRILQLTNELFAGEDADMLREAEDPLSALDTIKDLYRYFDDLTERYRAEPNETLASYIANGRLNGEYLPYKELISYYIIVATAGHDTTKNAISGGLHALITHPEQLRQLRDAINDGDEDLLKLAVEEMLRWTTPVVQFSRTATRDYQLRDKLIRSGESVGLMYASASFDEEVFDAPERFDINRKPNRHLAFGTGPHQCIGLLLARLEMRLFFQQLIPRLAEVELAEPVSRIQASFVHGIKRLPLRYRLTPAND